MAVAKPKQGENPNSAALFYRRQGIRVYQHQKFQRLKGGGLRIHFSIPLDKCSCPECGSRRLLAKEWRQRELLGAPSGLKKTTLIVRIPKIECLCCHTVRQAPLPFARPRRHYTLQFEKYVLTLLKVMTVSDVSKLLDVRWDTINSIGRDSL